MHSPRNLPHLPAGRCLAVLLVLLLGSLAGAADEKPNLITNGGFEDGTKGWMWEQWKNKPLPGAIDKENKTEGAASFKMGMVGVEGGRWLAKEIAIPKAGQSYLITLSLKAADLPENVVHTRVGIDGKAFLGSATGKVDFARTSGTHDWKEYKIGLPADEIGDSKKVTLFIYHDKIAQGTLWIDALAMREATAAEAEEATPTARAGSAAVAAAPVVLSADTSRPQNSTFPAGEKVELKFQVALAADVKMPAELRLTFLDAHDQQIDARKIPVTADGQKWETTVVAPSEKLGYYRVKAELSDGTLLAGRGSRRDGFLTYAVVPDPKSRPVLDEDTARFGMQGVPYVGDEAELLGARWVLDDGLFWRRQEPDRAGQFDDDKIAKFGTGRVPGTAEFPRFTLPTLFVVPKWAAVPETFSYQTGRLTPEGEKAWAEYLKAAAKAYTLKYPDRKKNIYQITWEPIRPWGFKGTDADLLKIYEIAYTVLHEVDPKAVVAGPCRGIFNNGDPPGTAKLLAAGLGKYLDAYTSHPYHSHTPEKDGMVQAIRHIRQLLRDAKGHDIPMYGTEQGLTTYEDPARELDHAQVLMRQNLITLGEGYAFNLAFTHYDYRLAGQKGYGYHYNLEKGIPFGNHNKVSPKVAVPAYAAQSLLIDGSTPTGAIEWLGTGTLGYAFERNGAVTLALWCYEGGPRQVSVPTGVGQVKVYDWMGNAKDVDCPDRTVKLQLGLEPVYVTGVSPALWGSGSAELLALKSPTLEAFTGQRVTLAGNSRLAGDKTVRGKLMLEPESPLIPSAAQEVVLGGEAAAFTFDLDLPATLAPGTHVLRLKLSDDAGRPIAGRAVNLKVLAPIAVKVDTALTEDGQKAVALTLVEKQGLAAKGKLTISLKELLPGAERSDLPMIDLVADPGKTVAVAGSDKEVTFDLQPKGRQRIVIPMPEADLQPAKRYEAVTAAALDGGSKFVQTDPVHFLHAVRLAEAPGIDADLAEWAKLPPVQLKAPRDVVRSPAFAPQELAASLRYAWDDRCLYLVAEVQDANFVQIHSGLDVWKQDCLQLGFNLDPGIAEDAVNADSRRISEINVALTPKGPGASRSLSSMTERLPVGDIRPEDLKLAVKHEQGRLIYELAIPWATLGATQPPKAGETIGVAVTANDVRDAKQGDPSALGLFGGIVPAKDASKFGLMTLAP